VTPSGVRRFGSVIRLRPAMEEEYLRLHANVWPEVLRQIHDSGMHNYTIFLRDGWLFSYFEYVGDDFEADMARMAADPTTQDWWKLTDPCQERLETAAEGEQWSPMREVFHVD